MPQEGNAVPLALISTALDNSGHKADIGDAQTSTLFPSHPRIRQ
jgi:hypothetical protein